MCRAAALYLALQAAPGCGEPEVSGVDAGPAIQLYYVTEDAGRADAPWTDAPRDGGATPDLRGGDASPDANAQDSAGAQDDAGSGLLPNGCASDLDCPAAQRCDVARGFCACAAPQQPCGDSCCAWELEIVDREHDVGMYSSLALTRDGLPRIAYYDADAHDLRFAAYDGSRWQVEVVDSEGIVGQHTSLVLDASGRAAVAYFDFDRRALKIARQEGGGWRVAQVPSAGWAGEHASLALGGDGRLRVAFFDNDHDDLLYGRETDAGWQVETVDAEGDVGRYCSLTLDADDQPIIAYLLYEPDYDLKLARHGADGWSIETLGAEGRQGMHSRVAIDGSGEPLVVTYDADALALYAYRWRRAQWQRTTIDGGDGGNAGWFTSIAVGPDGLARVAYYSRSRALLQLAVEDGPGWSTGVVDSGRDVGGYTSIALDDAGRVLISYYDRAQKLLKLARG